MKVKEVMMGTPASCGRETNLAAAVEILWNRNCGILPVTDDLSSVVGVITDRDICIALGTRNRVAGDIIVGDVASDRLFTCKPNDDIRSALVTMGNERVRRLPVVDEAGKLLGILSMDDVLLHAQAGGRGPAPELSYDNVALTLRKLYQPQVPELVGKSASAA